MTKLLSLSCVLIALAACDSSSTAPPAAAKPVAAEPAAAAAATAPAAPAPPPAPPNLDALAKGASVSTGNKVDATTLGTAVDAYLVTTAGKVTDEDPAQEWRLSLLVTDGRKALVAELGKDTAYVDDDAAPAGKVIALPPFPRGHMFDLANDVHF